MVVRCELALAMALGFALEAAVAVAVAVAVVGTPEGLLTPGPTKLLASVDVYMCTCAHACVSLSFSLGMND